MSTIQPPRRTFADWLSPLGARCGVFAALMLAFDLASTQAQDPADVPPAENIRRNADEDRSYEAVKIVSPKMSIDLMERFSKDFEFGEKLIRVDGFDDKVINVISLDPSRLRVRGLEQGVTTMVVTGASNMKYIIEVYVCGDARLLQSVLKRRFPGSAIECNALLNGSILLTGYVTDNQTITQIMEVARVYAPEVINHMRVGGPQEVQLRVKVLEVQRSKLRQFGIDLQAMTQSAVLASTPSGIATMSNLINPIGGSPTTTLTPSTANPPSLTLGISGNHFAFDLFAQMLKEEGLLKVMSEPVLTARSGEAARLSDGGQFPIPVPGGLGTVTIEFREFGVILETLPIVISPTRCKVQVTAEVSDKDTANSITLLGTTVPGITSRKVQSTVDMNFGDTMVLAGMISTREQNHTLKTPFVGELPLVGAFFRKVSSQWSETELIILITPEFGGSLTPDQVPVGGPGLSTTSPTDRELYRDGLIEVPKYGPNCPPNGSNCPTDCPGNFPSRIVGGYAPPGAGYPESPSITPAPPMMPTGSPNSGGLIAPSGTGTASPVPPPPSTDPGVSRRTSNGSSWLTKSRPAPSTKSKDADGSGNSPIQPAGFKKTQRPVRPPENQYPAKKSDDDQKP